MTLHLPRSDVTMAIAAPTIAIPVRSPVQPPQPRHEDAAATIDEKAPKNSDARRSDGRLNQITCCC